MEVEVEEVDLRLDLEAAAGALRTLMTYCLHNYADVHINCSTLQVMMRIQRELFDANNLSEMFLHRYSGGATSMTLMMTAGSAWVGYQVGQF